jgi:secondary thiamine-phosphate synthase enzyme
VRTGGASIEIQTAGKVCVRDVTPEVRQALETAGLRQGLALITVPHTTCGLCVNEAEPGLLEDLTRLAARLVDPVAPKGGFAHDRIDANARAHLFAALLGGSVVLPVHDAALRLGSWQSVLLIEADGPRRRRLEMTFLGE